MDKSLSIFIGISLMLLTTNLSSNMLSVIAEADSELDLRQDIEEQNLEEQGHDEEKHGVVSSTKKIVLTKIISLGFFASNVQPSYNFTLLNISDQVAKGVQLIPLDLTVAGQTRPLNAIPFVNRTDIQLQPTEDFDIQPNGSQVVSISLDTAFEKEGRYEGELLVSSSNFDTLTIGVELTVKEHPRELVLFTILGVVAATPVGALYTLREKMKEIKARIDDDEDIISHINGHIRTLNLLSTKIDQPDWKNIYAVYEKKWDSINKYRKLYELDPDAEAVKWFEVIDNQLQSKVFFHTSDGKNKDGKADGKDEMKEIESPLTAYKKAEEDYKKAKEEWEKDKNNKENLDNYKKAEEDYKKAKENLEEEEKNREKWINKKTKEKIWSDLTASPKKAIFFIGSIVVSIPTTYFTTDIFVGEPLLNVLIAFSLGLIIYRTQDIQAIFTKKESLRELAPLGAEERTKHEDHQHH